MRVARFVRKHEAASLCLTVYCWFPCNNGDLHLDCERCSVAMALLSVAADSGFVLCRCCVPVVHLETNSTIPHILCCWRLTHSEPTSIQCHVGILRTLLLCVALRYDICCIPTASVHSEVSSAHDLPFKAAVRGSRLSNTRCPNTGSRRRPLGLSNAFRTSSCGGCVS